MIDLKDLRENPDRYKAAVAKKRVNFDIDAFLKLDEEVRLLKNETETLRAAQNAASKEIPKLQGDEKQAKIAEMKQVADKLKASSDKLVVSEEEWKRLRLFIPSIPLDAVPEGKDDSENVEIRKWGEIPSFSFTPKSHIELGNDLDIVDIERGVKIAGSRNYFLKGDGALLQHAVLNYTRDFLIERGFTLLDPPHIVNYEAMEGTSYFPGGEEQAYKLDERDNKYLIGTSEVSLTSYHMDEILDASELPKKYIGYSPCYRREAGTYGKDTAGLYRIHQFYKVEQVVICKNDPAESAKHHAEILKNAEDLIQSLNIPYRVVDVCGGDIGMGQVYKNDIESWMPSRDSYGETHSCSTFHDFQARRLNLRYRDTDGNLHICHTLNNTCIASPRILISLLELNQNEDGSVNIPEPLQSYMGGRTRISKS
ncbi:MAG: serine--tRNA ligase [Deltaproteobacteria bacterium]|nr:serine--tRNA ligase [Deltaproteobacteria bacterium]